MKLYIITRADLPPGAQAAQACHGAIAFAKEHPVIHDYWYKKSNNLVLLALPNEQALLELREKAREKDASYSIFREPDFDNTVTAVVLEPDAWRLVSSAPLALRKAA